MNAIHLQLQAVVLGDAAFPKPGESPGKIHLHISASTQAMTGLVRASKENEKGPQNGRERKYEAQLTSARQAAEWGMRQLQGAFPRLKARFPFEERGHRRIVMRMISALNNYRARTIGIAQSYQCTCPNSKGIQLNYFLTWRTTID